MQVLALEAEQLLCHVTPLLLCENEEAVVEAARAFGNFSRLPAVREYMLQARVLDALVLLLDHGNAEVLYSVCGTLINFLMDPCMVQELVSRGGVRSLIDVLGRMAALEDATDMELAVTDVACKALFNIAVEANKRAAAGSSGSDPRATSSGRAAADSQSMTSPELNFSGEELEAALLVLEHLEASSALQEEEGGGQGTQQHAGPGPGMGQDVAHRLATQLQRLQARLASLELEDLPGPGA